MTALLVLAGVLVSSSTSTISASYFGFWGPDPPAAMSGFTNLAFASSLPEVFANRVHGIDSLLKIEDIFVNQSVRWHFRLNDDYETRWAAYAPQLTPLVTNRTLLGFFLGDELLWNGLNFTEIGKLRVERLQRHNSGLSIRGRR